MNPTETPELTVSARRTLWLADVPVSSGVPRKYKRYVGSKTKPHGFTAASTPNTNE